MKRENGNQEALQETMLRTGGTLLRKVETRSMPIRESQEVPSQHLAITSRGRNDSKYLYTQNIMSGLVVIISRRDYHTGIMCHAISVKGALDSLELARSKLLRDVVLVTGTNPDKNTAAVVLGCDAFMRGNSNLFTPKKLIFLQESPASIAFDITDCSVFIPELPKQNGH